MKRQYSNTTVRSTSSFTALMIVVLISVAFFGFDTLSGGVVRSYARTMGSLAWLAAAGTVTTIDHNGIFETRRSLTSENEQLKEQLARMGEEAARFQSVEDENTALRELAHLAETERGLTVRVLSSYRTSPYGTFVIAAGENDGVAVGDVILTTGGFVLGEVSDLDTHTATVESLFAPGKEMDFIVHDVAFTGIGRGNGNTKADISRDALVAVGDTVHSPRYGRVAGIIGRIESASSSATQTLFVQSPVNVNTLSFVYVVTQ